MLLYDSRRSRVHPAAVTFGDGFYGEEREGTEVFRWMSQKGHMDFAPESVDRFLELQLFCEFGDLSQKLTARCGNNREILELVHGWTAISIEVPAGESHLLLESSRLFPRAYYPSDSRSLAFRVRRPGIHADPERHLSIRRQWRNEVLNTREMLEGKTILASTPTNLGIDLHGVCNVKPPCVYCEWDESKEREGDNVGTPFTVETLTEYGEFFSGAAKLNNCSIGEPFMMRNLDELLDVFGDKGKTLAMSTNGQLLTEGNIQKLVGRNIELYVSLDAATSETYARLRNNTFDRILDNIRQLVRAREKQDGLPKIYLVFMPMPVNVHELDAFVQLAADLHVDKLILRPLNAATGKNLEWERGGYQFRYDDEFLSLKELVRVSGRAAELCRRVGVELSNQLDFGGALETTFEEEYSQARQEMAAPPLPSPSPANSSPTSLVSETDENSPAEAAELGENPSLGLEKWPVCTEPWQNLYILRRGVLPCSYGRASIAGIDGFREAWNSSLMQEIRAQLLAGSFHEYCLKSFACPIVRKFEGGHRLSVRQRALLKLWRSWQRLNSLTFGIPGWLLRQGRLLFSRHSR